MKDPELEKTTEFVLMFDKFFDCLNVSSLDAGKHSRNAYKSPYRSVEDFRIKVRLFNLCVGWFSFPPPTPHPPTHHLNCHYIISVCASLQWLKEDFIGYLDRWQESVSKREGFSKTEQNKMMLSEETRAGLRLTGNELF